MCASSAPARPNTDLESVCLRANRDDQQRVRGSFPGLLHRAATKASLRPWALPGNSADVSALFAARSRAPQPWCTWRARRRCRSWLQKRWLRASRATRSVFAMLATTARFSLSGLLKWSETCGLLRCLRRLALRAACRESQLRQALLCRLTPPFVACLTAFPDSVHARSAYTSPRLSLHSRA